MKSFRYLLLHAVGTFVWLCCFFSEADEAPRDCWGTDRSPLTLWDDLQETPLGKADFSGFTDGSYWKDENGEYRAACAPVNP